MQNRHVAEMLNTVLKTVNWDENESIDMTIITTNGTFTGPFYTPDSDGGMIFDRVMGDYVVITTPETENEPRRNNYIMLNHIVSVSL